MSLRAELYCYFCGHGCGEVQVSMVATQARRPSPAQLRAAYSTATGPAAPVWDTGEQPRCPRCGGQLFLERYEYEVVRRSDLRTLKKAS